MKLDLDLQNCGIERYPGYFVDFLKHASHRSTEAHALVGAFGAIRRINALVTSSKMLFVVCCDRRSNEDDKNEDSEKTVRPKAAEDSGACHSEFFWKSGNFRLNIFFLKIFFVFNVLRLGSAPCGKTRATISIREGKNGGFERPNVCVLLFRSLGASRDMPGIQYRRVRGRWRICVAKREKGQNLWERWG